MRKAILAAVMLTVAGCSSPPAVSAVAGPSAQQLAHGRWLKIPAAPVRLCDPLSVWDGRNLVTVEPGWPHCRPGAAAYNPRTNSWATLAAPPRLWTASLGFNAEPVGAWGGGRLVLVSPGTGRAFVVITLTAPDASTGTARAFALTGERWMSLPALPRPASGRIAEAVTAVDDGAVYALANVTVTGRNGFLASGSVELLRLTPATWAPVLLTSGVPLSELMLTRIDAGMLAAGSPCPGRYACTLDSRVIALLKRGARPGVIPLLPSKLGPSSCPGPLAAAGQVVVATCPQGPGMPSNTPAWGSSQIYDTAARLWQTGPTIPSAHVSIISYWGTYWTRYGVVSLGPFVTASRNYDGWLLRPAR